MNGATQCDYCDGWYTRSWCPAGCKSNTVSFQTYGHVTRSTPGPYSMSEYYQKLVDQELKKISQRLWIDKEEDMCEKKEPTTKWTLRIGVDGKEKYTVEFKKRTSHEHQGYTVSSDDYIRTFDTFEEALKYTNETHKNLSK